MSGLLILLLTLPAVAWEGFVLSILWRWFLVPLGVAPVGVWAAAGIALVVGVLTHQTPSEPPEGDPDFAWWLTKATLIPAWCLLVGWLIHSFAT